MESNFNLVNKESLDKILRVEVFVHDDGQLRAAHIILGYKPISSDFQAPKCMIRARDPCLHRISVAVPGFLHPKGVPVPEGTFSTQPVRESDLLIQSISEGIPRTDLPSQYTAGASGTSKHTDKEEVVEVLESEDEFTAFNHPLSPEASTPDLGPPFSPIIDEMGIQRKPKSSLLDLIESQLGDDALGKAARTKPPIPPPVLPSQAANLKRKKEPKRKKVMGAGQTLPLSEDDVQKASKQARTGQRGTERGAKKRSDPHVGSLAWLLAPMLNGEPLLANASIRDFQGGIAGYVADTVEQALLLPEDMAELRDMRRHEVFLSLKRYLAMACPPLFFLTYSYNFPLLTLVSFLGKLFKPLSGLRRWPTPAIDR